MNDFSELKSQIVSDVNSLVASRLPSEKPGRMGVPVIPAVVLAFIPQAVQMGLDVSIQAVGKPLGDLVQAERDHIRSFVSNSTLKFLDGLIQGLEDAPAQQ